MARRMAARLTKTSRTLRGSMGSCAVSVDCFSCGGRFGFRERAGVHDEVDVALAVAELDVFEAVVLVGQREHGLREEADGRLAADGQRL